MRTGALPVNAEEGLALADDYTEFDIEDLLTVQIVTSVSKKSQTISDAPSAVFVITQDDLRRSGVTSIADALRMVPGIQSSRINSHAWAVTTRGFASGFSNKLLVLIDGRSVYTPDFSGVYWEITDMPLDDIERIEVVRGPGGTLWGANAVNGVINIITKHAKDTQGGLLNLSSGSHEEFRGSARYGGTIGEHGHYRVYVKTRTTIPSTTT